MKYSKTQKHDALLQYLCGHTPKEIAENIGVHFTTVYRWIDCWKESSEERTLAELPIQDMGAVLTRIAELQKQLDEQKRMLSIIHESQVLQSIPLNHRINIALRYTDIYSATQLGQIFEIKLSTLYYHMRIAREGSKCQRQEDLLRSTTAAIFEESGKRFGAERIRLQMKKQGIRISKKRVIRLMKQMGLYSVDSEVSHYCSSEANGLENTQDVQILQ